MTENTDVYFQQLATGGYQPLLHQVTGTMRFDIAQGDGSQQAWRVAIDHGKVDVRRDSGDADCVIAGPEDEFECILDGRDSFAAAFIRGAITVTGEHTTAQNIRRFSHPARLVVSDPNPA